MNTFTTSFHTENDGRRAVRRDRSLLAVLKATAEWVCEVNRRRKDRELLRGMTFDQLRDMGIDRADVEQMSIFPGHR